MRPKSFLSSGVLGLLLVLLGGFQSLSAQNSASSTNSVPSAPTKTVSTSSSSSFPTIRALPPARLNFKQSDAEVTPSAAATSPAEDNVLPKGDGTSRSPLPTNSQAKELIDRLDDINLLGPGDRITYQVLEDRSDPHPLTVNSQGEVDIPYLGRVSVNNKTPRQFALFLKTALEKDLFYRATPIILVDEISRSRGVFYLYGQIHNPGQQNIATGSGTRISRAILNAGGLADYADKSNVTILRGTGTSKEQTLNVDLDAILDKPNGPNDLLLEPDDVVTIPVLPTASRSKVLVYGRVNSPGELDLPANEPLTLSRAILKAGGFAPFAERRKVRIFRRKPNSEDRDEIVVDVLDILEKGRDDLDVTLQPNDHVMVMQKGINF